MGTDLHGRAASDILKSVELLGTEAGQRHCACAVRHVTRGKPVPIGSGDSILILKCDCILPV